MSAGRVAPGNPGLGGSFVPAGFQRGPHPKPKPRRYKQAAARRKSHHGKHEASNLGKKILFGKLICSGRWVVHESICFSLRPGRTRSHHQDVPLGRVYRIILGCCDSTTLEVRQDFSSYPVLSALGFGFNKRFLHLALLNPNAPE